MAKNNETKVTFKAVNKEFNQALSEMKNESSKLRKEFSLQQEELKQTGTESEKLTSKLTYLEKSQEIAAQKVEEAEKAFNKIKETYGENSIEADKMSQKLLDAQIAHQKLGNQVSITERDLNGLENSQRQLQHLFDATGTDVEYFSDVLGSDLTSAIKHGTASSKQLDSAINQIGQAALGTDVDLSKMKQSLSKLDDGSSIKEVKKDLSTLSKEANEAEKEVGSLGDTLLGLAGGLAAGGGIAGIIEKSFDVSSLNTKIDITFEVPESSKQSVKAAIKGVEAYGIDAEAALEGVRKQWALNKDASDATNSAIAKGAATIAANYEAIDFTELIQETNEIGGALKISNKEALGLVNSLLKGGFPPDQLDIISEYGEQLKIAGFSAEEIQNIFAAGVDTKTWNIDNLLDGLKEGKIGLSEFGLEVPKATKELLSQTDISAKQMQTWGAAVAKGGSEGSQAMFEVAKALAGVDDATVRNELGVQLFGTKFEDQGMKIVDTLINAEKGTANLGEGINQLAEDTSKMDEDPAVRLQNALTNMNLALAPLLTKVAEFVGKIALWASENPKLLAAFVAIGAVLGIIGGALMALIPVFLAMSMSMLSVVAPIAAVIAGIGLFVAALIAAYNHSTTFRDTVNAVFNKIKEVALLVFETVASFIGEKIAQIKQFWDENGIQILQAVQNVFNGIKAVIEFVMPLVIGIIKSAWENIKGVIDGALNIIMGAVKIFAGLFTGDFSKMWEGIKQVFKGALEFIWNLFNLLMIGKLIGGIKSLITSGLNLFKGFGTSVGNTFKSLFNNAVSIFNNLRSQGVSIWNALVSAVKSVVLGLVTAVKTNFNNILLSARSIFNQVKTAITNPVDTAKTLVKKAIDSIVGFFKNMKLSFPKIKLPKLPHFKLSGDFSLKPPSVPKLSVDWYKDGGVFTPNSPRLIGIGDAKVPEAAIPLSDGVLGKIGQMIADTMEYRGSEGNININLLGDNYFANDMDIDHVSEQMASQTVQKLRAKGVR